jgi:hypothetical protein
MTISSSNIENYFNVSTNILTGSGDSINYFYHWVLGRRTNLETGKDFSDIDAIELGATTGTLTDGYDQHYYRIAPGAFSDLPELTSVKLGRGVLYVGDFAFSGCVKLTQVNIINTQVLQSTVETNDTTHELELGFGCFQGCNNLISVVLPFVGNRRLAQENKTHFGYIFGCKSHLEHADKLPQSLQQISFTGVSKCGGSDNTELLPFTLYPYSFANCTHLTTISIPKLESIPDDCFNSCLQLQTICTVDDSIPDTSTFGYINLAGLEVTHIGARAFFDCHSIVSVFLPENGVSSGIGDAAFKGCYNLIDIHGKVAMPNWSIRPGKTDNGYIGYYALDTQDYSTSGPIALSIGTTLAPTSDEFIFRVITCSEDNPISYNIKNYGCYSCDLTEVYINSPYIGDHAFNHCNNLKTVVLDTTVTAIGAYAFENCPNLETVIYKGSIRDWCNITFGAFPQLFKQAKKVIFADTTFTDDTITESITIPNYAFCYLTKVYVGNDADSAINSYLDFSNIEKLSLGDYSLYSCLALTKDSFMDTTLISLGDSALTNCTKEIFAQDNYTAPDNTCVLQLYRLNNMLARVELPEDFMNYTEFCCTIDPANVNRLYTDAFKDVCTTLYDSKQNNAHLTVFFNDTDIRTWAQLTFETEASNPMYQASNTISSSKLKKTFKLLNATTHDYETFGNQKIHITFPVSSYAFSGFTFENIEITNAVDESAGSLNISSKAFTNSIINNAVIHPSRASCIKNNELKTVVLESNTDTVLASYAFANAVNLQSITIQGAGNISFGAHAFANCPSINQVSYNKSLDTWCSLLFEDLTANPLGAAKPGAVTFYCNGMQHVTDKVKLSNTLFKKFTLCNLSAITGIEFTKVVDVFETSWLVNCARVDSITAAAAQNQSSSYKIYDNIIFKPQGTNPDNYIIITACGEEIDIPTKTAEAKAKANLNIVVKETALNAFTCSNTKKIILPNDLTYIAQGTIHKGVLLENLVIPFLGPTLDGTNSSEKCLGYIFGAMSGKENFLYVPASLQNVAITASLIFEADAFLDCKNIKHIYTAQDFKYAKTGAFSNCTQLAPGYLTAYTDNNKVTFLYRVREEDIVGSTLTVTTSVYADACLNLGTAASKITTIRINNLDTEVVYIGNSAFTELSELKTVIITTVPETKLIIDTGAFRSCQNLDSLDLPATLQVLGTEAFSGCTKLTSLTMTHYPDSVGTDTFKGCDALTIAAVPVALLQDLNKTNIHTLTLYGSNYTTVPDNSFENHTALQTVTLATDITGLGAATFKGCTQLYEINLDAITTLGNKAFYGCNNLYKIGKLSPVLMTNILKSEGEGATPGSSQIFEGCYKLCEVCINTDDLEDIKQNLEQSENAYGYLGYYFKDFNSDADTSIIGSTDTSNIREITQDDNVTYAIYKDILVTVKSLVDTYEADLSDLDQITTIGKHAFAYNKSVTKVIFGGNLTTIDAFAFYNCSKLIEFKAATGITNKISKIGMAAFAGTALTSNILDDTFEQLTELADSSIFENCIELKTVYIPATITLINPDIFKGCNNIETIEVGRGSVTYEVSGNCLLRILATGQRELVLGCASSTLVLDRNIISIGPRAFAGRDIVRITVPKTVKTIGAQAFANCTALVEIIFESPSTLELIDTQAFANCSYLSNLTLPVSLEELGTEAFSGCSSLGATELVIPANVSRIYPKAFSKCNLTRVTIKPNNSTSKLVATVGDYIFSDNNSALTIYGTVFPDATYLDSSSAMIVNGKWKSKWKRRSTNPADVFEYLTITIK